VDRCCRVAKAVTFRTGLRLSQLLAEVQRDHPAKTTKTADAA